MTTKVDGTNGVLQSYDFQVLTTGFSYTFAAGTQTLIANPAGTLATGTITMPAAPVDGMVITIESTQQITALTVAANTGQTLVNGTLTLRPNQPVSYMYRLANTTWYPYAGAANTQIVSGTAQASTSGTSIDFTSIPSWVKRITVMFSGVSTNGTSLVQIQLGDSGGVETTGYNSGAVIGTALGTHTGNVTTGFVTGADSNSLSTSLRYGSYILSRLDGNTWVGQGNIHESTAYTLGAQCAGAKTLSATLDRVRITTVNGTDAFDAGSINIMYE